MAMYNSIQLMQQPGTAGVKEYASYYALLWLLSLYKKSCWKEERWTGAEEDIPGQGSLI